VHEELYNDRTGWLKDNTNFMVEKGGLFGEHSGYQSAGWLY